MLKILQKFLRFYPLPFIRFTFFTNTRCFQETFFSKMSISRGHFYTTIEEAETAIKEYSKEDYFVIRNLRVRVRNRESRRIKIFLFVEDDSRRIQLFLFVGNRPRRIKIILLVWIPDE